MLRAPGGERDGDPRLLGCPLAVAVEGHPEVCRLVETLLSDVLAVPVRQRCQTDPLQCRFEFDPAAAKPA